MPRNMQCSWDHAPYLQKIISINTCFKCNDVLSPARPQKWNSSLWAKQVVEALKRNFKKAQWRHGGIVGKRRINRDLKVGVYKAGEKTKLTEESWSYGWIGSVGPKHGGCEGPSMNWICSRRTGSHVDSSPRKTWWIGRREGEQGRAARRWWC